MGTTPSRNRTRRRILIVAAGALAVVVLIAALAPWIVSAFFLKGVVQDALGPHVRGSVAVTGAEVSWFGPQRIHLSVRGEHDTLDLAATIDNGLVALIGSGEPLSVRASAALATASRADGSLTVMDLLIEDAPATPGDRAQPSTPAAAPSVPEAIRRATLVLDPLEVSIHPLAGGRDIAVKGGAVTVSLAGADVKVKASGATAIGSEQGSFDLSAVATNLVRPDNSIGIATAGLELSLKATALPVSAGSQDVILRVLDARATAESIARSVELDFSATVETSGPTPSGARGHLRVSGLLTPTGSLSAAATASGQIALDALPTVVLGPFLRGTGIEATRDLGAEVDAAIDFDGASASITAHSDRFSLTGHAHLDQQAGRAIVQDLLLDTTLAKEALVGWGVPAEQDVPVRAQVERAVVPLNGANWMDGQVVATVATKGVVLAVPGVSGGTLPLGDASVDVRSARISEKVQVRLGLSGGDIEGLLALACVPRLAGGDIAGAHIEVSDTTLNAHLGPELLGGSGLTLRRPVAASVTITHASCDLDTAGFDASTVAADVKLELAPCSVGGLLGPDEWLDVAATSIAVGATAPGAPIRVVVSGGASGFAASADLAVTGLADGRTPSLNRAHATGTIQVDAIDLSRVPHVPERSQRISGLIGLGRPVLSARLDAGADRGTAQLSLKGPAADLTATVAWEPGKVTCEQFAGSIAVADGLPELLGIEQLRLAAPATVALAGGGATVLLPAASGGGIEVSVEKLELRADRLALSECPGVAGALVLESCGLNGSAAVAASGTVSAQVNYTVAIPQELGVQGSAKVELPPSGPPIGTGSATVTLPAGTALAGRFVTNEFLPLTAGPGTVSVTWTGDAKGDAATVEALLAKVRGRASLARDRAQGRLLVPTAEASLAFPRRVISRLLARQALVAADWSDAVTVPMRLGVSEFVLGDDLKDLSLKLDATLGAWASEDPKGVGLTTTRITATIPSIERGATATIASDVTIGGGAATHALLELDVRGDLRGLLMDDGSIDLADSSITLHAPGALVQSLFPATTSADGTSVAGVLRLEPKAMIDARVDIARAAFPVRVADSAINATFTIGAIDAAVDGRPARLERARGSITSASLGRSCAVDLDAAFGDRGAAGSVTVKGAFEGLGQPDGSLGTAAVVARATAKATSVPLGWVDSVAGMDGELVRACGEAATATIEIGSPSKGVTDIAVTLDTTYLDFHAPRVRIADGFVQVDADAPLTASLIVNDTIRAQILESINPILSDIKDAPPIKCAVTHLRYPLDGDRSRLDADARMEVGDATVVKSNQLLGVLKAFKGSAEPSVPAHIGPLAATVRRGKLAYKDFVIGIARTGTQWQLVLNFSGDIDLARQPTWANAITARYPLNSIVRTAAGALGGVNGTIDETIKDISNAINMLPLDLGGLLAVDITFSGPLGQVNGKDVPLKTTVHPVIGSIDPVKGAGQVLDALDGLFGKKKK